MQRKTITLNLIAVGAMLGQFLFLTFVTLVIGDGYFDSGMCEREIMM